MRKPPNRSEIMNDAIPQSKNTKKKKGKSFQKNKINRYGFKGNRLVWQFYWAPVFLTPIENRCIFDSETLKIDTAVW